MTTAMISRRLLRGGFDAIGDGAGDVDSGSSDGSCVIDFDSLEIGYGMPSQGSLFTSIWPIFLKGLIPARYPWSPGKIDIAVELGYHGSKYRH